MYLYVTNTNTYSYKYNVFQHLPNKVGCQTLTITLTISSAIWLSGATCYRNFEQHIQSYCS